MTRKTSTLLLLTTLLLSLLSFVPSQVATKPAKAALPEAQALKRLDQIESAKKSSAAIRKARELLVAANLPFEPNLLFSYNWKKRIAPYLDSMAAMHRRRKKVGPLNGVEIADRLTLPVKVQLTGDTVILANELVFAGRNVEIKGPHSLFVFPVNRVAAVDDSTKPNQAHHRQSAELVPLESLSINLDAEGRKEWLEKKGNSSRRPGHHSQGQNIDETPGATGHEGTMGSPGQTPDKRPKGAGGNCDTNPDGSAAVFGLTATQAGPGDTGGRGINGKDAGLLNIQINQTTGTFNYSARGGDGGQGGPGGPGGFGAIGGAGGDGGDGVACPCGQSRSGIGGAGGDGGPGGAGNIGGTGGTGGTGGKGGVITLTVPCNFAGTTIMHVNGGNEGPAGEGGRASIGGLGGPGGAPGHGAVNSSCPQHGGGNGPFGGSGPPGINGFGQGDSGQNGTRRGDGNANVVTTPGCGGGEQDVLEPGGFNYSEYCTPFYWVHYSCDCFITKNRAQEQFLKTFWGKDVTRATAIDECTCEQVGSPIYAGCF